MVWCCWGRTKTKRGAFSSLLVAYQKVLGLGYKLRTVSLRPGQISLVSLSRSSIFAPVILSLFFGLSGRELQSRFQETRKACLSVKGP